MKIRFRKYVATIAKAVRGQERSGHKYCRRIPSNDGYIYIYPDPSTGRCGGRGEKSEKYDKERAKKLHPEDFQDKKNTNYWNINNDTKSRLAAFQDSKTKNLWDKNADSAYGEFFEKFISMAGFAADGSSDDVANILINRFEEIKDPIQKFEISSILTSMQYLNSGRVKNGDVWMRKAYDDSVATWESLPDMMGINRGKLNPWDHKIGFLGKSRGLRKNADIIIYNANKAEGDIGLIIFDTDLPFLGPDIWTASLKKVGSKPISVKMTDAANWIRNVFAENSELKESGIFKKLNDIISVQSNEKRYNLFEKKYGKDWAKNEKHKEEHIRYRQHEIIETIGNYVNENREQNLDGVKMILDAVSTGLKDERFKKENSFLIVSYFKPQKGYYRLLEHDVLKEFEKAIPNCKAEMNYSNSVELAGRKFKNYSDLTLKFTDPKSGKVMNAAYFDIRRSRVDASGRIDVGFFHTIASKINKSKEIVEKLRESYGEKFGKSKESSTKPAASTKPTPLGVRRAHAKYIRKIVTKTGKVRYIYKETDENTSPEEEPINRNKFSSGVDSVSDEYITLFEEACREIDDEHFISINAGVSAVKFTENTENFLNFINASDEQRQDTELRSAAGTMGIMSGKIAFNTSKFPDGVSDLEKKLVMLHEVFHGYFYGNMRIKQDRPLSRVFEDIDKDYKKNIEEFTKDMKKYNDNKKKALMEEARSKKVKDEEMLYFVSPHFVSEYAATSDEDHFAELGAYYFLMPEILKKKETEAYKIFNDYFKKY